MVLGADERRWFGGGGRQWVRARARDGSGRQPLGAGWSVAAMAAGEEEREPFAVFFLLPTPPEILLLPAKDSFVDSSVAISCIRNLHSGPIQPIDKK